MADVLVVAGTLAAKEPVHASAGTFRAGALTFFRAGSLGPIVEQFSHGRFF